MLAKGDPVRLFLESIAAIIVQQRILIDYTGKQNLLAYAEKDYLEHIGVLVGTDRLQATAAMTTFKIALSEARNQNIIIPAGTRATPGNDVFFATKEAVVVSTGELSIEVEAVCTEVGSKGNGYTPGQINKIVDPLPWVASIVNLTTSEGGSETEGDDPYRERIHQAPEQFSCAGPDGAYEYHAKRASALIHDVSVDSPCPCEVEIRPLLNNGEMPGQEIIDVVANILNTRNIRPLTDHVTVLAPEKLSYDIDLTYWIDKDDATNATAIKTAIDQAVNAYIAWQKEKLGRDLNPTELIYRLRSAGAKRVEVVNPVFTVVAKGQIAIMDALDVKFGGLEDG